MLLTLLLSLTADPEGIVPAKLDRKTAIDYEKEIRPIFAGKCITCHSGNVVEGMYLMSTRVNIIKGGKKGPAIVPGKPAESNLYLFSSHRKKPIMPPKSEDNPLTPVEVALIERWISEGAKGPEKEAEMKVRAEVALSIPAAIVVPIRAVAVAPDQTFAAAARSNLVSLYDPKTGVVKKTLIDPSLKAADGKSVSASHVSLVESMAVSPDSKTIATGSFREVTIWDTASGSPKLRIGGFAHSIMALAYSPNGKLLAVAGGVPTEDGEVKIIDPQTGKFVIDLKRTHSDTVFGVAFSPDGKLLATASADKFVKVLSLFTGQLNKNFEGHTQHVLDVTWTPDGKRIVSASADSTLKVWDYEKGEKVRDIPGFPKQVTRLAAIQTSPIVLTTAGDGALRLINAENGGTNRSYPAGNGFLFAVACSPNGEVVIAGGEDGVVRIYEGKTGKVVKEIAK